MKHACIWLFSSLEGKVGPCHISYPLILNLFVPVLFCLGVDGGQAHQITG